MLTGIHILLTYKCTHKCDHCFLYSGPDVQGTMTLPMVRSVLQQAKEIDTVEWIFFEGGEPFLFYPSLIEGVRLARNHGFKVGIVTNCYGALSEEDAEIWLQPLADLGVSYLSVSDDAFHYEAENNPAKIGLKVAGKLGISTSSISIQEPTIESGSDHDQQKGTPIIGGGVKFRGRAVEKLTPGLPAKSRHEFIQCPYEDLRSPSRVHIDCYGHVHLCQGVAMGNIWKKPLSSLLLEYDADAHPICGPLLKGGPDLLAYQYNVAVEDQYVDECHLCFIARRALVDSFPEYLTPKQVYGLPD
ncbi:radical SAM protein [Desulfopila sp. IMCC35008]|uniref:radical SAM protein n=1 Tax=Desulfopila sp. IMCC35008 TaxID=2653858 RepID=UPI0013D166C1|nr:radical SAM protein [Desulfopila sp. IMCC35008]